MLDIILDTLIDAVKLLPFLFITFLVMEYLEHKMTDKNKKLVKSAGKIGPLIGSLLGAFPQCGFSVAATNFYATRVISIGTLIAVYLSTSDEMLPILISERASIKVILFLIITKIIVGIVFGFIIDFIMRKSRLNDFEIKDFCNEEHCDCKNGILKSSVKHTLNILLFIVIISFVLNIGFEFLGENRLSKIFMKNSVFGPFISSLIGLIPNCGASVVITELYINNTITLGSVISGLLTGSGVAIMVLFKVNKNLKENINIVLTIYFIGVIVGLLFDIFGIVL